MKLAIAALLLTLAAPAAMACDLMGIRGQVSDNGQTITSRQPIALKEQARQYGGYWEAANVIEQNRQSVLQQPGLSAAVRQQVDSDLSANVQQLRCWAQVCSKDNGNSTCQL